MSAPFLSIEASPSASSGLTRRRQRELRRRSRASSSASSARTAPARRRCSTSSPASFRAARARCSSTAEDISALPPHRGPRLGLGRTFQISQTLTTLTVLENAMVGAFLKHRASRTRAADARGDPRSFGLGARAPASAGALTLSERRRLEVARALALEPADHSARRGHGRPEPDRGRRRHPPRPALHQAGADAPADRAQSEGRAGILEARHRARPRRQARRRHGRRKS